MEVPNFKYEKSLWKKGYKVVSGADEVGRGCFAGPVVAAAVAFAPIKNSKFTIFRKAPLINDSKKLKPIQREEASEWIKKSAMAWGIGEAGVSEINNLGMTKATNIAFRRAILSCESKIDYLLIDAFYIPYVKGIRRKNQKAIIKGDTKSVSIAAASIIAKVYRDKKMLTLSKHPMNKKYGWGRNKGYGTREHQEAIRNYGITKLHRVAFVNTFLSK